MRFIVCFVILCGFFLSACQANTIETSVPAEVASSPVAKSLSTPAAVSPAQEDIQTTTSPSTPLNAGLQSLIDKAMMDLAQQLSVSTNQISFIQAISATWSDSSLGCPQPGMTYSQAVTPGYLIQLQADDRIYEFHTDVDQHVVFCGENTIEFPIKPGDIKDDEPWMR